MDRAVVWQIGGSYVATAALAFIGTDAWNAQAYQLLSDASRLSVFIKRHKNHMKLALYFARINRALDTLFTNLEENLKASPSDPVDFLFTPEASERLVSVTETVVRLRLILTVLVAASKSARLQNSRWTAGRLAALSANLERVDEIYEWFLDLADSETLRGDFEDAEAVYTREGAISLESLA